MSEVIAYGIIICFILFVVPILFYNNSTKYWEIFMGLFTLYVIAAICAAIVIALGWSIMVITGATP